MPKSHKLKNSASMIRLLSNGQLNRYQPCRTTGKRYHGIWDVITLLR